jgi:hypothetical protein
MISSFPQDSLSLFMVLTIFPSGFLAAAYRQPRASDGHALCLTA